MVVDTSALVAILLGEPEAGTFALAISRAPRAVIPASVYLETSIVLLFKRGELALPILDELLRGAQMEIASFDESQARIASEAFIRYGKGRHRAGLNFGDCMSYALAKIEVMPLLCRGDDFRLTDVELAV